MNFILRKETFNKYCWQICCLIQKLVSFMSGSFASFLEWLFWQKPSFILNPDGECVFIWSGIVALSVVYNYWSVILKASFVEMRQGIGCLGVFDGITDGIYILDVIAQFRVGYLEDGIVVRDPMKLGNHYMKKKSFVFVRDLIAAFPTSNFCYIFGASVIYPLIRMPKLLKLDSFQNFVKTWDMKTNRPNLLRGCKLLFLLATVIHWNACIYHIISEYEGIGSNQWVLKSHPSGENSFLWKYMRSFYWSTMTLTTIGENSLPETNLEFFFTGLTFMVGVLVFAAVVGNVGDVISNMNAARLEFQQRMDTVKIYMSLHRVPEEVQTRIKKWADYSWNRKKAIDDPQFLDILPFHLRAEIAKHVHLETLRKVRIFEECEKGLLCELAVRLKSQIYSPGDYICRTGEIGKEMYIINHGKVEVLVSDDQTKDLKIVATLSEGNYFGEISLLEIADGCNRRMADVRSVGYSELLVLSKKDFIQAFEEYPDTRRALEKDAIQRITMNEEALKKQRKDNEDGPSFSQMDYNEGQPRDGSLGEIRDILKDIKSFNTQNLKKRIEDLEDKCSDLQTKLDKKTRKVLVLKEKLLQRQSKCLVICNSKGKVTKVKYPLKSIPKTSKDINNMTEDAQNLAHSPSQNGDLNGYLSEGDEYGLKNVTVIHLNNNFAEVSQGKLVLESSLPKEDGGYSAQTFSKRQTAVDVNNERRYQSETFRHVELERRNVQGGAMKQNLNRTVEKTSLNFESRYSESDDPVTTESILCHVTKISIFDSDDNE